MLSNLTGWHFLIVLAVVVLLFGATRLPALAKGVGQATRIFKSEIRPTEDESKTPKTVDDSTSDEP
jgi:sec-independent protein translocase protein TatA